MARGGTFFDAAYGESDRSILAEIRRAAFGEDIGQFSWITADELRKFCARLQLNPDSHILDVACGSGGPALFIAQTTGCRVTGVDMNESGIASARETAEARRLQDRARFELIDARAALPRSEEHTSELQSRQYLVCRLLLEKKKQLVLTD